MGYIYIVDSLILCGQRDDLNRLRPRFFFFSFFCSVWALIVGRKLYKQLETDEESGFRLARTDGSVTEYTTQCQRQVQETLAGIRGRVGEAEQLYAELQCGIQHAREVRRLEAGVEAVTGWVLGPGADLLRQLILRGIGQDPDSVLVLQQELEHLELKCRVSTVLNLTCNTEVDAQQLERRP